jgi:hypothetical protein
MFIPPDAKQGVHQVAEDGVGKRRKAPINTAIADELGRYPNYAAPIAPPVLQLGMKTVGNGIYSVISFFFDCE